MAWEFWTISNRATANLMGLMRNQWTVQNQTLSKDHEDEDFVTSQALRHLFSLLSPINGEQGSVGTGVDTQVVQRVMVDNL